MQTPRVSQPSPLKGISSRDSERWTLEGKGADQASSQQDKFTLENIDVDDMIL